MHGTAREGRRERHSGLPASRMAWRRACLEPNRRPATNRTARQGRFPPVPCRSASNLHGFRSKVKCPAMDYASANSNDFCSALAKVRLAVFLSLCRPQKHADIISKSAMLSKGVGLHYTAFRDVNPAKPPIATQYRQLSMRKKSERRLNVESRAKHLLLDFRQRLRRNICGFHFSSFSALTLNHANDTISCQKTEVLCP